jgi:hypothetical protein
MPNQHKVALLGEIQRRFGALEKLPNSNSLFSVGGDAARIYLRYSKLHPDGRTFFGLREDDLRQLAGRNAFICFFLDDHAPPVFVPYADFEDVFHRSPVASDRQHKVQLTLQRDLRSTFPRVRR